MQTTWTSKLHQILFLIVIWHTDKLLVLFCHPLNSCSMSVVLNWNPLTVNLYFVYFLSSLQAWPTTSIRLTLWTRGLLMTTTLSCNMRGMATPSFHNLLHLIHVHYISNVTAFKYLLLVSVKSFRFFRIRISFLAE